MHIFIFGTFDLPIPSFPRNFAASKEMNNQTCNFTNLSSKTYVTRRLSMLV